MGSRVTRAAAHLPAEEVKRRMTHDPRFWCRQRWLIMYQALIAPRKAEEIATHTGASLTTVRRVISTYNRFGVAAVETPGTGGRRHEYLTLEQERAQSLRLFSTGQQRARSPRSPKSSAPLKRPSSTPFTRAASIASYTAMPGASSPHAPSTRKPTQRNKPRLKKLRGDRPSGGRYACPRRSAPRVKDGRG
jgi:hypothetical protein